MAHVSAGTVMICSCQTHVISGNRNTAENQNAGRQARLQPRPIGWPKERKIIFAARKMSAVFKSGVNVIPATAGAKDALQDLFMTQHTVLVGLMAHLTGIALQDDIVSTTRRMQQLGADILGSSTTNFQGGDYASQNSYSSRADPPGS